MKRLWIRGLQYQGETQEQFQAREKAWTEEQKAIEAEEQRLREWKERPIWKYYRK